MRKTVLIAALLLIAAAAAALFLMTRRGDETVASYGAGDRTWVLSEIGNMDVAPAATLRFADPGRISGTAPCNSYAAAMTVPYPWFEAVDIAVTRMTCAEMAAEQAFFTALSAATYSEVMDDTLVLSNDDGPLLVFTAGE
jgi:heat shock protein HslJ